MSDCDEPVTAELTIFIGRQNIASCKAVKAIVGIDLQGEKAKRRTGIRRNYCKPILLS
jgi:hypothetical protein